MNSTCELNWLIIPGQKCYKITKKTRHQAYLHFLPGENVEKMRGHDLPVETTPSENELADITTHSCNEDKLVCGRCEAEFSISQIQRFIQHKQTECLNNLTESALAELSQLGRTTEASATNAAAAGYNNYGFSRPIESQGKVLYGVNYLSR